MIDFAKTPRKRFVFMTQASFQAKPAKLIPS